MTTTEAFETWRESRPYGGATARDEQCFRDGYDAATERAAKQEREECAKAIEAVGPKEGALTLVTAGFAAAIRARDEGVSNA